ncbi:hypothetical protein E4T38_02248 [Aureobasidium subglaciale]|nr:hypothetical protein E4T38_02248 [Aureobasidium subglaciale]KAI5228517.1 hypothetical protein E4T40_02027 [Aureobasidium subglaciale]KAI5232017.1 hypothetical protein E4T41_02247 [Aureobasidium subglaciale]KAI5265806.1 hypothetical protein E4T46_02025 [Aureobasidium subglaciale]
MAEIRSYPRRSSCVHFCSSSFHEGADNPGYFEPRRYRRGSIRIKSVHENYDPSVRIERPRPCPTRHLCRRLSIKIRSVISSHHTSQRNSLDTPAQPTAKPEGKTTKGGQRPVVFGNMRAGIRGSIGGPVSGMVSRPALTDDVRAASDATSRAQHSSVVPGTDSSDKPLVSGSGVNVSINLAEPALFLQGFEQNDASSGNTAMLRGTLHLRVTKAAKIKAVTLKFKGRATTKWPEGIPPRKVDFEEVDNIMSHTWPFFNAQFPTAEAGPCADHVELFKSGASSTTSSFGIGKSPNISTTNLTTKDQRRLSLQVNQSRSFGKGESSTGGPSVAQKGYRTFNPGDYVYNFELPIDSRLPETIDVDLGSVKYELEAVIERAGAFRANLVGVREVQLIRAPAEGSLEQVEPIAISRNWEDQLHYDIVISGKSFPLGAQVPIAFKLTPLAKVQCHRIKVLVTENIEYFCSNKRVHRMEPTRKVQLFEKRADQPPTSTFPGSTMRVTAGGGVPYNQRAAAAAGEPVTTSDPTNLLGNLEGENIGPTEMEFSVQLPNCTSNRERERATRLHFDTTYQNIQVHHWIKIVMRLSKPDTENPGKRRHFEISIDSPFHILSCRATQANTSLPAYTSPESASAGTSLYECGCPNAVRRRNSPTSYVPTLNALNGMRETTIPPTITAPSLTRPQAAHLTGAVPHNLDRPIHLLRAPSFNPPAFEDEEPPPPLITPPPQYDSIASPTSGLADYFARLSDAYDDDEDSDDPSSSRGRVDVPLTPGARVNRSMDVSRSWVPLGAQLHG